MVSRGTVLVSAGLLLFVVTLGVGAVTAPDRSVSRAVSPQTGQASQTNATTPNATATHGTAVPGPTTVLIGSQGGGPKWQKLGRVYRVEGQQVAWNHSRADSNFDVTRLPDGRVVAGFLERGYESGCAPYDPPCIKTGYRVIEPDGANGPAVVEEFAFPVRTATHSEVHDVEPLGDGRFLIADMEHERIAVVENGTVTWEWRGASFYEAPPDPTRRDWLHINDVDVLAEGRYLVSVRNANQLLVVERGQGVVDVVNADRGSPDDTCLAGNQLIDADGDGDVRCGDPAVMNHQHNPQWLGDGRVLVADSENDRVVELAHRDNRWTPVWQLTEAGDLPLYWPRDADRLPNGNTLVTDSLHKRVFVVRPDGTLVWSYPTKRIPYEADMIGVGEPAGAGPVTDLDGRSAADTRGTNGTATTPSPTAAPAGAPDNDVPVLSTLLVGLQAVYPRTPVWFGETQLGFTLLSLGLVVGGTADRLRDR